MCVCVPRVQCTVGYGDITAQNDTEREFMCVVLLVTALTYAIIFGNLAVQIQELDRVRGAGCGDRGYWCVPLVHGYAPFRLPHNRP